MTEDDLEYYSARMVAERRAARRATHPMAAQSHDRLANVYAAMIRAGHKHSLN